MNNKKLIIEKNNSTVYLILNRPEIHNAFDYELIQLLRQALAEINSDKSIQAVVLKANGKNFSAGADINWMQQTIQYTEQQNFTDAMELAYLLYELFHLPKPTIALVQGAAYGGGVGLVACCDIVIADNNAHFCLSEVKIGLIPAVISPYLVNAIGHRQARRYCMTAEKISAKKATQLGLVDECFPTDELLDALNLQLQRLAENSPAAITRCKQLLNEIMCMPIDQFLLEKTATEIAKVRVSAEAQFGLKAFLSKQKPNWKQHD